MSSEESVLFVSVCVPTCFFSGFGSGVLGILVAIRLHITFPLVPLRDFFALPLALPLPLPSMLRLEMDGLNGRMDGLKA